MRETNVDRKDLEVGGGKKGGKIKNRREKGKNKKLAAAQVFIPVRGRKTARHGCLSPTESPEPR